MSTSSYQAISTKMNSNCYPIDWLLISNTIQRVDYVKTDVDLAFTIRRPFWKRTYSFRLDKVKENYHLIDINWQTGWVMTKTVKKARRGLMHDFCLIVRDNYSYWKEIEYCFPSELKLITTS